MWNYQCGIEKVKTLKCFYNTEKEMGWITLRRRRIFCLSQNKHICFVRFNNVPPNIHVGTTTSVVTTTIGLEEQASAPGSSGYIRSCAQSLLL